MSTPTQRERFEAAFRRLRAVGITPVAVLYDTAARWARLAPDREDYEVTASMAGTPGRWAGTSVPDATWIDDELVHCGIKTPVAVLLFVWPLAAPDIGDAVVTAFGEEGFGVERRGGLAWGAEVRLIAADADKPADVR
ncbi:hypothetical protein I0C86_41055 [Plantactinospora sp. S1510]|uniref:Uncharacterized protein n=1 Tax=Plantactinospora alkalitolerans TaxID=2789879 RepID=A0ABS0HAD5_9ACTN|nr:hypothetical protein [Plantactinospora alkalitolerans]MBF9135241.1 hypothetical protein [Plantactinospora alkalitolerans]